MNRCSPLLAIAVWLASCSVTPDDAPYASQLSPACDACLTGTTDTSTHCGVELETCDDDAGCEQYVLCQLRFDCYRSAPSGSCEREAGCVAPEPVAPALAFEACARTTCGGACRFEAPN